LSDFHRVAELLEDWPTSGQQSLRMETSLGDRTQTAIRGLGGPAGPLDIAGLVSQLLRREALRQDDWTVRIRVPRADGWPTREQWNRCLCRVALTRSDHFLLEGKAWQPAWLCHPGEGDPLRSALAEEPRRRFESVPADPAVEEVIGFATYRSSGQRMAVRSALLLQPGGTLLVVLPTGDGKSLAIFARALLQGAVGGLTLVVVPTVALALDQARRARELFEGRPGAREVDSWAFHGGLSPEEKQAVRRRIREGTQPILYASPESVMLSLRPALIHAARSGRLRTFVIDEAHLVAQWGTEFRPEFQAIAGLRRTLLSACEDQTKFQTLLLTATLTEEAWWTLQTLFGEDGIEVCASVSLRAEPDFFVSSAATESQRTERVTELAHVLPRPFILYTTTRQDCDAWARRLEDAGLARFGKLHGGTSTSDREEVLAAWAGGEVDVMVATSAFGLGMDQSDVRAVVHACVPETTDRFYQEVGRGGRDGKACLSFLVHTDADLALAQRLSQDRIISVDKGLARWSAMHREAEAVDDEGAVLVRLDAKPPKIAGDSDANVAWNLRTLVLMARAGLLRLQAHSPPELNPLEGESEEDFSARRKAAFDEYAIRARVLPASTDHLDKATWNEFVQKHRLASRKAEQEAIQQLRELISGQVPFSEIFRRAYRVDDAGIAVGSGTLSCPAARRAGVRRRAGYAPTPLALRSPVCELGASLARAVGQAARVFVSVEALDAHSREAKRLRHRIVGLLERLVMDGLREVSTPEGWLQTKGYRRLYRHAQPNLVMHTPLAETPNPLDESLQVPRLTLLWPSSSPQLLEQVLLLERPLHLILLSADAPDLRRPDRTLLDTRPHLTFEDFERRLG